MASLAVVVNGVKCRLNFKRANIVVGTTAAKRKLVKAFDFKGDATHVTAAQVEALVRAQPGFNELVARAVAELPAADEALLERSDGAARAQARAAAEQQQTEVLVCRPNRTAVLPGKSRESRALGCTFLGRSGTIGSLRVSRVRACCLLSGPIAYWEPGCRHVHSLEKKHAISKAENDM